MSCPCLSEVLLIEGIVGHHHGHLHLLMAWLHHLHHGYGPSTCRVLATKAHHGLSGLIDWHSHGSTLVVVAANRRYFAKLCRRGYVLPGTALHWALLLELLLLGATTGQRSEAGC
jgi:hypothetical protein